MSKILACTDGSSYAASVYDHAAWAASRLSGAVEVLHVLDHHRERAAMADMSGNLGPDARDELLEQLTQLEEAKGRLAQKQSRAILQAAESRILAAGVAEVTLTQRHGSLVECLAEIEARADMVVIGKRGENAAVAMDHLGANLERVIRASHRPVLVASREFKPVERILIAFDGGASARKAVDYLALSPLTRGLDCHLLSVAKATPESEQQLAWARTRLEGGGLQVRADMVAGEPEEVICRTVKAEPASLLVMGAYGHSRIRRFIVGSTTTAMVRTCHVPVLMFR